MKDLEELIEGINQKHEKMILEGATKKEIKGVNDALKVLENNTESQNEEILKVLKTQGELINGLDGRGDENITESEEMQITKFVKENAEAIKDAVRKGTYVEFEVQAATKDISTASGTLATNPKALGSLTNSRLRNTDLMKYANVSETSRPQFSYSEAMPTNAEAAKRAEGDPAVKVDLTWKERFVTPSILSAHMVVTQESLEDVVGLPGLIRDTLRKKHDIKVEKDVYFGDGVAPNSLGATEIGTPFVGTGMAASVTNPSLLDYINACVVEIAGRRNFLDEDPYIANLAFVNPIDFFLNFSAKKDANGLPMYPNATLFNTVKIGNLTIVPTFRVAQGDLFVADMKRYNVVVKKSYLVRVGVINEFFLSNQKAIVGESRYYAYVQELDKKAFLTTTITEVDTIIKA